MPTFVVWNQTSEANKDEPMYVYHSNGLTSVIDYDRAINIAVPTIAARMNETERQVMRHFQNGDELQIDDDVLAVI